MPIAGGARVLTPDDVMDGATLPQGTRVLVWDDDHYYMGGVMAELLADMGCETHYLTPACEVSTWTRATMEQHFIQARLLEKGVKVHPFANLDAVGEAASPRRARFRTSSGRSRSSAGSSSCSVPTASPAGRRSPPSDELRSPSS